MFFGMDRATDEQSLIAFLKNFSNDRLTQELVPRLTEDEIHQLVDQLTQIMKNHLNDEEYHALFLNEPHPH